MNEVVFKRHSGDRSDLWEPVCPLPRSSKGRCQKALQEWVKTEGEAGEIYCVFKQRTTGIRAKEVTQIEFEEVE